MAAMQFRKLSEITGLPVRNRQDQELGDIENVVLDLEEGRPVYALVAFGGFLGLGEKMAAIPWSAVDIMPSQEIARIDTDRETLQAIAFDEGSPPDLANLSQAEQIHQRFGQEPYWQTFGYTAPGGVQVQPRSQQEWQPGSKYNQQFDPQSIVTKSGTIQNVGTHRPAPGASEGLRLRVHTDDGQTVTVYAGPKDFAQKQGMKVHQGEQITVTGSQTTVNGRTVIMATQIQHRDKTLDLRSSQGEPMWSKDME